MGQTARTLSHNSQPPSTDTTRMRKRSMKSPVNSNLQQGWHRLVKWKMIIVASFPTMSTQLKTLHWDLVQIPQECKPNAYEMLQHDLHIKLLAAVSRRLLYYRRLVHICPEIPAPSPSQLTLFLVIFLHNFSFEAVHSHKFHSTVRKKHYLDNIMAEWFWKSKTTGYTVQKNSNKPLMHDPVFKPNHGGKVCKLTTKLLSCDVIPVINNGTRCCQLTNFVILLQPEQQFTLASQFSIALKLQFRNCTRIARTTILVQF